MAALPAIDQVLPRKSYGEPFTALQQLYIDSHKVWIVDSGAAFHVMRKDNVVDVDAPGRLKDMAHPTSVDTADGGLYIDKYVE